MNDEEFKKYTDNVVALADAFDRREREQRQVRDVHMRSQAVAEAHAFAIHEDRMRQQLREQAVRDLVNRITDKGYHTVRLVERTKPPMTGTFDPVTIQLDWEVVAVDRRKVVMMEPPDYTAMTWKRLSGSALDEIKYRVRGWFRKSK